MVGEDGFVAAPQVAPQFAAIGFVLVVVYPFVDEEPVFVRAVFFAEVVEVGRHEFDGGQPQLLLCAAAHGQPGAQLFCGVFCRQGAQLFVAIGVVDMAVAACAKRVPGEVFEPVAVLVFGFLAAGGEARPGVATRRQAGGEEGVVEVEGVFGKRWRGGAAALGEQGAVVCLVFGKALCEEDVAADACGE